LFFFLSLQNRTKIKTLNQETKAKNKNFKMIKQKWNLKKKLTLLVGFHLLFMVPKTTCKSK
jgi:hypothetical protein